jgi:hypothetical protein
LAKLGRDFLDDFFFSSFSRSLANDDIHPTYKMQKCQFYKTSITYNNSTLRHSFRKTIQHRHLSNSLPSRRVCVVWCFGVPFPATDRLITISPYHHATRRTRRLTENPKRSQHTIITPKCHLPKSKSTINSPSCVTKYHRMSRIYILLHSVVRQLDLFG